MGIFSKKPTVPEWVGTEPIIEGITFGYGSYGYRCRLCGADNWDGRLKHHPSCPGVGFTEPPPAIPPHAPEDEPDYNPNAR